MTPPARAYSCKNLSGRTLAARRAVTVLGTPVKGVPETGLKQRLFKFNRNEPIQIRNANGSKQHRESRWLIKSIPILVCPPICAMTPLPGPSQKTYSDWVKTIPEFSNSHGRKDKTA